MRGILLGLGCLLVRSTLAQETLPAQALPDLAQSPSTISFSDWQPEAPTPLARVYRMQFASPFTSPYPANNTVYLRAFLPRNAAAAVGSVIVLHYWGAGDDRIERNLANELNRRGLAAILLELPYHLRRTPPGARSGSLAITPDPAALSATMTQSVLDIRRAVDWIQTRPEFKKDEIGVVGTSLGGIVAATVVGVEPRLSRAAFVLAGADLAGILWRSSRVVVERERLRRRGFSESSLRAALEPIEPLNRLSGSALRSALVIGARFDTVVPPENVRLLLGALSEPEVIWLDTGHYGGFFVQKRVQSEVARFFEVGFSGGTYVAPTQISGPTVRVGVDANPTTGLQVAIGLDIWKSNARGDVFSTAIATPRGLQLFLGVPADRGLAFGLTLRRTGVTGSAYWSIVL